MQQRSKHRSEQNSSNVWDDWIPEHVLADVLAGRKVIPDIGQVKGLWKQMLQAEVRAGRLVTWRGKWHPVAGAAWGVGPDKTCYGTPEMRDCLSEAVPA